MKTLTSLGQLHFHREVQDTLNPSNNLSKRTTSYDFSKVQPWRLEVILPKLIQPDQARLIRMRHSCDKVHRLLNIIDTEKRFRLCLHRLLMQIRHLTRLKWAYFFGSLLKKRLHLGTNFIHLVKLYSAPYVTINSNGLVSENFRQVEEIDRDGHFDPCSIP